MALEIAVVEPATRPILFSAPMVRAILAGTKTQTRRVVKPVKFEPNWGSAVGHVGGAWRYGSPAALGLRWRGDHWSVVLEGDVLVRMCMQEAYGWGAGSGCPYGVPGNRLWCRESHYFTNVRGHEQEGEVIYRADHCEAPRPPMGLGRPWRPSIHMPRGASRILLEVTEVRVERLQDISEADCIAEGVQRYAGPLRWVRYIDALTGEATHNTARDAYAALWESINGPGSWQANPWVWAISFRVLTPSQQEKA